jgi:hypothetical protein
MIFSKLLKTALVVSSLVGVQAAHAALVTCPTSFTTDPTAKVEDSTGTQTAVSACQYVTPTDNNNVASVTNINTTGFFGHSDWTLNGGNLQVGNGGATGTWTISNDNFADFDYMIVFKDGADTNLIGFLFNELFSSGVWSTPFIEPPFDFNGGSASHNVSHYTIVQRPNPTRVPEPGIVSLLGIGLAGFAVARRRSLKK